MNGKEIQFANNISNSIKAITGSYVGNGLSGETHPITIQFEKDPLFVFVTSYASGNYANGSNRYIIYCQGVTYAETSSNGSFVTINVSNGLFSWYSGKNSATDQLNRSGFQYYYFALL